MKYITASLVAILVIMFSGCSDGREPQESEAQNLPKVLAQMQGSWVAVSTNGCTINCGVDFDGYSVRVRYQESPDSSMVRTSALVERVDEQKQLLIINGGVGAWEYSIGTEEGLEYLELEFYSRNSDENWRRMYLKRAES